MRRSHVFLIICEDPERLMLFSSVLHRVFPNAVVQTCRDSAAAFDVVKSRVPAAIVVCRTAELDALSWVQRVRAVTAVPIVAVSRAQDRDALLGAGATRFLDTEQWLLAGKVVAEIIGAEPTSS